MSNTLIKSYSVNYASSEEKKKQKRIIDSNQAVSERIKALSEMLENVPEDEFAEEFSEGLDAEQVDALLTDQDELAAQKARDEEVQKLIEEANAEAERIISEAGAEADRLIEEANAKAGAVLEEARARGEAEGNEKGYAEGLERAAAVEEEARQKAEALEAEYEEMKEALEPKLVETLTGIYSHVFGTDLSGRSDVILYLLKDTIRNVDTAKTYLVHVSRDDSEYVNANKEELTEGIGSSAAVEIIEDVTLSEGNCFIETDGGIFDCSLGTELELLKKELKILSYGN